jgi:hypothetical protein
VPCQARRNVLRRRRDARGTVLSRLELRIEGPLTLERGRELVSQFREDVSVPMAPSILFTRDEAHPCHHDQRLGV